MKDVKILANFYIFDEQTILVYIAIGTNAGFAKK